ncbi:MAG: LacI family transcriptional regulator [Anaerolineae bacterium]|jgi:DNA-binding LacI/PurR family transcriptional regulator|nr:LacI family transcriptional regulator [Anaerolineae bacterium]MDH7473640.1 LacI family DNA-binding transcriptional regulator [Anaerolineae bacterium]
MSPTIKDIAQLLHLSVSTVSKALNEYPDVAPETKQRVQEAARLLDYSPNVIAQRLQSRRTGTLGFVVYYGGNSISDPLFNELLASMLDAAAHHQYDLLVSGCPSGTSRPAAYERMIKTGRVDGFIVDGTDRHDDRIAYLCREEIPFVAFGRTDQNLDFPYVDVDGRAGVCQAVQHLIDLGHQRIGFIGLPSFSFCAHDRRQGYETALQTNDLPLESDLMVEVEAGSEENGYRAMVQLLELSHPPTAVMVSSDLMAIGALRAAQERNLAVGHDLALIGFDDISLAAYTHPPLTTLRQPMAEIGQRLVDMLVCLLENKPLPERHVILLPPLIVRQSSGERRDNP